MEKKAREVDQKEAELEWEREEGKRELRSVPSPFQDKKGVRNIQFCFPLKKSGSSSSTAGGFLFVLVRLVLGVDVHL